MKVKVSQLRPNPFREIGEYPIDRAKVESLKLSIKETSFWENVLCRRNGDGFEIAYGHHRLQALRELGIKEVNLPVKKLSDAEMIRIMAAENLAWLTTPAVINQTVISVKKFLDSELAKYETLEELKMTDKFIGQLFENQKAFANAKREDHGFVGRSTIFKFLGEHWRGKEWLIQTALKTLELSDKKILDRKAVEEFDSLGYVERFQRVVEQYDVPFEKQRGIARQVAKNIKDKKTSTQERVTTKGKPRMSIEEDVRRLAGKPRTKKAKQNEVDRIAKALTDIERDSRTLADRLERLRIDIKELGITQMQGLKPALAKFALYRLNKELQIWKGLKDGQGSHNTRNGQHALR
jgi:hypothetical protein